MLNRAIIATVLAAAFLTVPAGAMTVKNKDQATAVLLYTPKGGAARRMEVAAHHSVDVDCRSGGRLQLGKSSAICTAKTAKVVIKNGKLVI